MSKSPTHAAKHRKPMTFYRKMKKYIRISNLRHARC